MDSWRSMVFISLSVMAPLCHGTWVDFVDGLELLSVYFCD